MNPRRIIETVRSFSKMSVLVVGDLVLDEYLYGKTRRISREAPVPIVDLEYDEWRPGGAANTAANFASMGAAVSLAGFIGDDRAGEKLASLLESSGVKTGGVFRTKNRSTTCKTRVMAGDLHTAKQQLLRVDRGLRADLKPADAQKAARKIIKSAEKYDAIAFSDYGFGILAEPVLEAMREASRHTPVIADSRFGLDRLTGMTTVTPNETETEQALGVKIDSDDAVKKAGASLMRRLKCGLALITRGNRGMALFGKARKPTLLSTASPRDAVDVTGAGDTVVAAFALGIAAGAEPEDAALIANHAAGLAVMKVGAVAVSADDIIRSLEQK